MFSQFQCCSLTSETTAEASGKVVLDKTCRSEHIKIWSKVWWGEPWLELPYALCTGEAVPGSQLPGGLHVTAQECQVTPLGLPLPELVIHTHHSQLQEPWGWGLGKETENTFSSLSSNLTHFQCEDPEAASLPHQASCFHAVCFGWLTLESVVSMFMEMWCIYYTRGLSAILCTPSSSNEFHSGTLGLSALEWELVWTTVASNPTESWLLEKGPSKLQHLLSTLHRDLVQCNT